VTAPIAADQGSVIGKSGNSLSIHQKQVGLERQVSDRATHRESGGLPRVQSLDLATGSGAQAKGEAVRGNALRQLPASLGAEELAVHGPLEPLAPLQGHGGSHDGTCNRSVADLVYADHVLTPCRPTLLLEEQRSGA
jgi:hypothetical protein